MNPARTLAACVVAAALGVVAGVRWQQIVDGALTGRRIPGRTGR